MVDQREAIQSAFLDSLRTVVMIDDEFPSYEELCRASHAHRKEVDRARSLWEGFRRQGLACEVENDVLKLPTEQKLPDYILKCDLIVLDYHLSTADNGQAARRLLRKLLENGQTHLVLLYTAHPNLEEVWYQIAFALLGRRTEKAAPWGPEELEIEEQYNIFVTEARFGNQELLRYLRGEEIKTWPRVKALGATYKRNAQPFAERRLAEMAIEQEAPYDPSRHTLQISEKPGQWLRCDNLFVAIVGKNQSKQDELGEVQFLKDQLLDALVDWKPSFLRIMFNHARRTVISQGFIGDDHVLKSPNQEAGWHYYMAHGTPEERDERFGALYSRLFEDLILRVRPELESFSTDFLAKLPLDPPVTAMQQARVRACVSTDEADENILHALNEYLAFEEQTPPYVRTGTIFLLPSTANEAGICITPDCDLVPREAPGGWFKKLGQHKAVLFRAVTLKQARDALKIALEAAEEAKALFRRHEQQPAFFQVGDPHPRPELIFVQNLGRINRETKTFKARRIIEENGELNLNETKEFRVIGQLRDRYALRLLHAAGHHLSRIGVDFVNLPKSSS